MTEAEKKALYDCSIQGYLKEFHSKNHANAIDAFVDSMMYFTKVNLDPERTTCNMNELLHVVKNEIAKYVVKQQINHNETDLTDLQAGDNNEMLQMFFSDPVGFTAAFLENSEGFIPEGNSPDNSDPEFNSYASAYKFNIKSLASYLKTDAAKIVFEEYEKKNKTVDVLSSIEAKLPESNDPIGKAFEKQKPGFWEKLRNKTSQEYKNFKDTFEKYNDTTNELYGDDEALEKSAMAYLHHKFPNLKEGELPNVEQISKLSGAGKYRADFCLNVVESVRTNRVMQPFVNNMVDACKDLNLKIPDVKQGQIDQQSFQEQVAKEVVEENVIDNENVIEENNELVNENNLE